VLEVGDTFHFAGHIMPTLASQVAYTVTAPSGAQYISSGQANSIGYFYLPGEDFVVDEPGLWSVDVHVWHDGNCSGGATIPPYPSGDVLGGEAGRYWFYVVDPETPRLDVASPEPGYMTFENDVTPILITGKVPGSLENALVNYTISMPGFILAHGQVAPSDGVYQIAFDPASLHENFPNLDLVGRDSHRPGLSDTFSISLLLGGQRLGEDYFLANTITIQGQQVYAWEGAVAIPTDIYLPVMEGDQ
jgi:hypothetical protein